MSSILVDEWIENVCEETYFVTLSGTWNDPKTKVWETPEGKLYKIDRHNFVSEYTPLSNKRPSPDQVDQTSSDLLLGKSENYENYENCEEVKSFNKKCKTV
jgi:hypothetical protein